MFKLNVKQDARIAAYLRKSREDTEKGDETLTNMRLRINEQIEAGNFTNVEYFEEVASGADFIGRLALQDLLNRVQEGEFEAVIVTDANRLTRSLENQIIIHRTLRESGTKLFTLNNGLVDLDNVDTQLQQGITGLFSEYERNKIIQHMTMTKKTLAKGGRSQTGSVPYGYKWDKADKQTLICEETSPVFKDIVRWYLYEDISTRQVADRLNDMKIRSKRGGKWTAAAITRILRNPFYEGTIEVGRWISKKVEEEGKRSRYVTVANDPADITTHTGLHDPLITKEEFALIQDKLSRFSGYKGRAPSKRRNPNKLSSMIRCPHCRMVQMIDNNRYNNPYVQKCKGRSNHATASCDTTKGVPQHVIFNAVIAKLQAYKDDLVAERSAAKDDMHLQRIDNEIESYEAGVNKSEARIDNAIDLAIDGTIDKQRMQDVKQTETATIQRLKGEIATLQRQRQALDEVKREQLHDALTGDQVVQVLQGGEGMNDASINAVLKRIIDNITYRRDGDNIEIDVLFR